MAALQPFVNLQPFKGTEKENLNEFIRQLESCIEIAGVDAAARHQYLHLHLKGGALQYFDQLPDATRADYDLSIAALRERYQNDQRIQLQKILFSARKLKPSEESVQDFLTDLQRLALEAYPNVAARNAAGGRPAVLAENREQERNRRVREAFINGMPVKMKKFLMTQPEETTIEDLCAKAASRMIVDRLYPEDEDSAFNEVSSFSTKELLTGIQALSQAQDTLKQETSKLSTDLKDLAKSLQPSLNQLAQNNQMQNRPNQNNRQGQYNKRYNNNNRGNNNQGQRNNQQYNRNNYQNRNSQNWQQRNNPNFAQSGQKYCHNCNKFNHTVSTCWFRTNSRAPPPLPYPQYSAPNNIAYTQPFQMIPQPQVVPQWSPHYDVNNQYQQQPQNAKN